ncbi:MAG: DUF4159 domain-containing protein, partial [Bryobacteraceae bacterium]
LPVLLVVAGGVTLVLAQRPFRQFMEEEDNPAVFPADGNEKTEFVFGRLRYRSWRGSRYMAGYGSWSTDYPKADRQFVQGVRRLTRIHVRSVEQVVGMDDPDDIYNWPWLYGVEVGRWDLSDKDAAKLRDYLLRGGFLMVDDFHGTLEWSIFAEGIKKVFPDRPIVELENKDQIFHILYDLDERFQVPGIQYWYSGSIYERDGVEPRWRGIYDDHGRIMVAICHNMDLGDAWEWADHPRYPEHYASLAFRVAINYIIYAMTH